MLGLGREYEPGMRVDLLEAQASVDWVWSQLPLLDQRLEAWIEANVTIEIRDVPPPATHNPIVAFEKEMLPIAFSVEAGSYINTIRSSLDILAMALVRRHGLPIEEHRVYFPIADSEEALVRNGGAPLLRHLPDEDRTKLLSLKPYREGNAALWALHHLDIVRKHRRLLDVQIRPIHLSMKGSLTPGDFEPLHGEPFQAGAEIVIGLIRRGVPRPAMQSRFYVAMNESGTIRRRPVLATLAHLADTASGVIKLFDV
jgi:hypothetical protein